MTPCFSESTGQIIGRFLAKSGQSILFLCAYSLLDFSNKLDTSVHNSTSSAVLPLPSPELAPSRAFGALLPAGPRSDAPAPHNVTFGEQTALNFQSLNDTAHCD